MRVDYSTCDYCGAKLGRECEYVNLTWRHATKAEATTDEIFKSRKNLDFCNLQCLASYFSNLLKEQNETAA
jgi:hypothetical protein